MKIEVKNLKKTFGKEVALSDFNLTLEGNKIFGLLGKNGAGKTTFMRILAGYIQSTSGEVKVDGQNPFNNMNLSKQICFIEESGNFKSGFKVKDVLKVSSFYYPNWDREKAEKLVKLFRLKPNQKVKGLSKGMYSALGIIVGLSSNAPVTIFDEPYIGLDASFRSIFYELLLEEYEQNPRMIILSTHLIDEVSQLFEEVIILHEGKKMLHENSLELSEKHLLVSGKEEAVKQYIANKHVIHETKMFGKKSAIVFGEQINEEEALKLNLKVERCSIQDLFIHLTKGEVGQYA